MKLRVITQPEEFIETRTDFEQYALVYSKNLSKIVKESQGDKEKYSRYFVYGLDRFVRIDYQGKVIYRKCLAKNGTHGDELALGYRSQQELGIDSLGGIEVSISSAGFLAYYLHNSNQKIKTVTWITFLSFVLTVLSSIISVISLFVSFPIY